MKIKSHFEDDHLIAKVKSATVRNNSTRAKLAATACPSQLVVTKWGSWLNAVLNYAKNLPEVKAIVEGSVESHILTTEAS